MDSLRAALILGGVFFHAALPYRTQGHWNVRDAGSHAFFDHLARVLSSFRMPTFFFVAGFFCALTFGSRGAGGNLRRRLRSFGLPLLALLVLVQPLQYVMRLGQDEQVPPQASAALRHYFGSGAYMSHLWFLVNLIIYYVLAWALLKRFGPQLRPGIARLVHALQRLPRGLRGSKLLLALPCALVVLPITHALHAAIPEIPGLGVNDLLGYLPFFAVGFICFESAALFAVVSEVHVPDLVALVLIDGLAGVVHPTSHLMQRALGELVYYANAWVIGMLLVHLFRRWLDRPNAAVRSISDAAYTIYLFHHILVVALAALLLQVSLPGGVGTKYAVVVAGTCALTWLLHHQLIARYAPLRLLFNGRS